MMDIVERIDFSAQHACDLVKDKLLVVGVSGGADSLCLMDALHSKGYRIMVAHFDHQLRHTSRQDALRVNELAQAMAVDAVTGSADVAGYASVNHLPVEEAARRLRYSFLFKTAREYQAQAVAVGHTADDQVETVLMHLLRGSGLAGLKGMNYRTILKEWDASIPVVRPLLDIWREETHYYCSQRNLSPVEDASNQDVTFLRNRLRHELIPLLEDYNPQVRQAVLRMSKTLSGDWQLIEGLVATAWEDCLAEDGAGFVVLRTSKLLEKEKAIQLNLVRRAVGRIDPGLRDFDYRAGERTLEMLQAASHQREQALTGKISAKRTGEFFYIYTTGTKLPGEDWPQIPEGYCGRLVIPGSLALPGGWRMVASEHNITDVEAELTSAQVSLLDPKREDNPRRFSAWLDAEALELPLLLRRHTPGDRWQPLGMTSGTIKLSDFFTNEKLDRAARAGWPVLYSGNTIAWLPGFRPGQAFRVHANSERLAHIVLEWTG